MLITINIEENISASSTSFKESKLQIVKVSMDEVDSINVYRSSNKSIIETWEKLEKTINKDKATIITGDFNLCLRKYKTNILLKGLNCFGFEQLQNEASQIMGGVIDHVYWRDPRKEWETPSVERYSPYYSDHCGFLITLRKKLQKMSKLKRRRR